MENEELFLKCLKQTEDLYGGNHLKVAAELSFLGDFYLELDEGVKAQDAYERALMIIESNHGPEHREVGRALYNLGNSYLSTSLYRASDNERAKILLKKALGIKKRYFDPGDVETAEILHKLGSASYISNDDITAKKYFKKALKIKQGVYGPEHLETAKLMNNLGAVFHALEDYELAKTWYEKALCVMERQCTLEYVLKGTRIPFYYSVVQNLRNTYDKLGDNANATQCNLTALNTLKQNCALDNRHSKGRSLYAMPKHVTFLRGKRGNEPCWYYIMSAKDKQLVLMEKAKLGSINVKDYGKILYSGYKDELIQNIEPEMDHLFSFIRAREKLTEENKMELLNKYLTQMVKKKLNNDLFLVSEVDTGRKDWQYILVDPNKRKTFVAKKGRHSMNQEEYGKLLLSEAGDHPPKTILRKVWNAKKHLPNNLFVTRGKDGILQYVALDHGKTGDLEMDTKEVVKECEIILYSAWGEDPPEIICHYLCQQYLAVITGKINTTPAESPLISCLAEVARDGKMELLNYFLEKVNDVNACDANRWTALHHAAYRSRLEVIRYLIIQRGANVHVKDAFGRKPIHISSREGHIRAVEFFLDNGANVDETDDDNWTPLHYAAWKGDLEMVEYLVQRKADTSAMDKVYSRQPTHNASKMSHQDVVQFLISRGADVNVTDGAGYTPLHYATECGNIEMVKYLYRNSADISLKETFNGKLPIHIAVKEGHKSIIEFLIGKGADVNAGDDKNCTSMHYAAACGNKEIVEYLHLHSADIFSKETVNGCLPIHIAAERGHKNVVEFLISIGSDVNSMDDDHCTPIYYAAKGGDVETVEYLYHHNADISTLSKFRDLLPIHVAVQKGHKNIVEFLTIKGSDVNARAFPSSICFPYTAINGDFEMASSEFTLLHYAAINDDVEMVDYLCHRNAEISVEESLYGTMPIHMAAKKGNKNVVQFFLSKGVNVNIRNSEGCTPLHYAVSDGELEMVEYLYNQKADISPKSSGGILPVHVAAKRGDKDVVEFLISKGTDINARGFNGNTPLHCAASGGDEETVKYLCNQKADISSKERSRGRHPIHMAVKKNHKNVVELLINKGADVNARDNSNYTPLHYAAERGNVEMVESLFNLKADVSSKENTYGMLPIHVAAKEGYIDVVEFLIGKGVDVNAKDDRSYTPLHYAASDGYKKTVEFLYNQKADISAKESTFGMLPIHMAAKEGNKDVVEFLISKGTDVNARDDRNYTPLHYAAEEGKIKTVATLCHLKADIFSKDNCGKLPMQVANLKGHQGVATFLVSIGGIKAV